MIGNEDIKRLELTNRYMFKVMNEAQETDEEVELPYYIPSENEMRIVRTFKDFLPQISPYVIFVLSSMYGRISQLLISPKAGGKSHIIRSVIDFLGGKMVDKIDIEELRQYDGQRIDLGIDDFSHIALVGGEKDAVGEQLSALSSLVQNGRYVDRDIKINSLDLAVVGGVVHHAYKSISSHPSFAGMSEDRFPRLWIFYLQRREPKRIVEESETIRIPKVNTYDGDVYMDGMDIKALSEMFSTQITYERTPFFVTNILKGHAKLCGRNKVTADDLEWLNLYKPSVEVEPKLRESRFTPEGFSPMYHQALFTLLKRPMKPKSLAGQLRCGEDEANMMFNEVCSNFKLEVKDGSVSGGAFYKRLAHLFRVYKEDGYAME